MVYPFLQTAALVVLIAAVAVHSPVDAAPQTETLGDLNQVITIEGQQCMCKVFHLCGTDDTVKNPSGIPKPVCSDDNNVCCKVFDESSATVVSLTTLSESSTSEGLVSLTTLSESSTSQGLDSLTTLSESSQNHSITPKPSKQCQCVPMSQCLDNASDIDIRLRTCENNQICCNFVTTDNSNNNVPSCGVGMLEQSYTETRVTSASDKTFFGQFPWMAIILRTDINQETNTRTENVFQCGGSLVHPKFVLTAAHCVRNTDSRLLKVRLGEWNTQSSDNSTLENSTHQDIKVHKIYVHPDHNNGTMYNDVALIELINAVTLQPHINTICIPSSKEHVNYDPQSCLSMGWGKNGIEKISLYQTVLKKVELSIVPNDLCQQQLRNTRLGNYFILNESFICAGSVHGEDVCKGDGGGPLICAVSDTNSKFKQYIQVGIVSWGIGCGDKDVPGVYSSVNYNYLWINQHINNI